MLRKWLTISARLSLAEDDAIEDSVDVDDDFTAKSPSLLAFTSFPSDLRTAGCTGRLCIWLSIRNSSNEDSDPKPSSVDVLVAFDEQLDKCGLHTLSHRLAFKGLILLLLLH